MARASAVKMPPEANAAHGCEGARRVLALMLAFSADRNTLTAREIAAHRHRAAQRVPLHHAAARDRAARRGRTRQLPALRPAHRPGQGGGGRGEHHRRRRPRHARAGRRDRGDRHPGPPDRQVRGVRAPGPVRPAAAHLVRAGPAAPAPPRRQRAAAAVRPGARRPQGIPGPAGRTRLRRPPPSSRRRSSWPGSMAGRSAKRRSTRASGPPRPPSCRASAWSRC